MKLHYFGPYEHAALGLLASIGATVADWPPAAVYVTDWRAAAAWLYTGQTGSRRAGAGNWRGHLGGKAGDD